MEFETPRLKTKRLILRTVTLEDWSEILHLRSDPQVNALVVRPLAKNKKDAIAFIEKVNGGDPTHQFVYWGLVRPEEDRVMGCICLWKFSEDGQTAEVGYDLRVEAQGQGYMTEALGAVLEFGFGNLGLATIEAYTQSNNEASLKLLERFGFQLLQDRQCSVNDLNVVLALDTKIFAALKNS